MGHMDPGQKRLKDEWKKLRDKKRHEVYVLFIALGFNLAERGRLPSCVVIDDIIPGYHLCPRACHIIRNSKGFLHYYLEIYRRSGVKVADAAKDGLPVQSLASPSPV